MQNNKVGFVGFDRGHWVHYCACGEWGSFGEPDGKYYCGTCRPKLKPPPKPPKPVVVTEPPLPKGQLSLF